jgi:hypothetical protein
MGRTKDASYEYSLAERYSPGSKIAEYSRAAQARLTTLQAQKSTTVPLQEDQDDSDKGDSDKESLFRANSSIKGSNGSTGSIQSSKKASLPPGTLELIRKQAALARKRAVDIGALEAENEMQKSATQAKSLQEKAERQAARARGGNEPVTLSSEEKERIRSQAAADGEQLKEIGKYKAAIKEQESRDKADEIQRQADNLQRQLLDEHPGESRLNPVGTNLYIRNYSKLPVTPLQAQAKSMSKDTEATLGARHTSAKIKARSEDKNGALGSSDQTTGSHSTSSVKGQVLNR